jgi:hypothetical protein
MLEKLDVDGISQLRKKAAATAYTHIDIGQMTKGAMLRAQTASGNCYLFEVIDPGQRRAHVVRCDRRPLAENTGYRGERKIPHEFVVGGIITHGGSRTSEVTRLELLS